MTDSAMPTDDSSDNGKHPYRRILMKSLTLALLLGCGLLVYLTPLKSWLEQGQMIVAQLAALGYWAPLAYVLAGAVLAAAGVPRMLICSLGGLAFGFVWGLAWSHLATLLGSYATFLFVRWSGRDWSLDHFPRLRGFTGQMHQRGVLAVLLIRQLPMAAFYNNLLLGLTPVNHRDFWIGSFLGYLPMGVTASLLGAGMIQADAAQAARYMAFAALSFGALGITLKWLLFSSRSPLARSRATAG
ncbi:TVP38/TMEM64 family protein [Methylogaea oryzae]|uniref:TVP38/TMEM64 family membrane protein n=1 Tax=Methylogaea oryzae TaxID=1295382 RepID=A0A8D4VUG4_9GAMM|nr:VTT domain-containing protein [Methylogaea oryzae]BBL72490.1 hypothetical protein MoryE10_30960 [Methylogaea oryzae]